MTRVAIVDYGVGNVHSVRRALARVGADAVLTGDLEEIDRAEGVVLPGVGAFAPALARLEERGLGRGIVDLARRGKPVLGVCLGYQLLFEQSTEHGLHTGLGLLAGSVVQVQNSERLPVIGWCRTSHTEESPLWDGIADGAYFYYLHSYTPDGAADRIGCTAHAIAAASSRGNVMGTQFHPEKSGADGLRLYANFLALCA